MCLSPILIKNVNYGYHANSLRGAGLAKYKDTESQYIAVPCNNCPVCISLRQNYFVQRVQMESLDSAIFFFTLTYNNETLPSVTVTDRKITYCDITHIQKMFKRIRKRNLLPKFKYVVTCERGIKNIVLIFTVCYSFLSNLFVDILIILNIQRFRQCV